MTTKKTNGYSWDSMRLEQLNFGSYSPKKDAINLRLSPKEKNEFKAVSDELGISTNLLLRVLMRQVVNQHKEGTNPIPDFQYLPPDGLEGV